MADQNLATASEAWAPVFSVRDPSYRSLCARFSADHDVQGVQGWPSGAKLALRHAGRTQHFGTSFLAPATGSERIKETSINFVLQRLRVYDISQSQKGQYQFSKLFNFSPTIHITWQTAVVTLTHACSLGDSILQIRLVLRTIALANTVSG